MNFLIIFTISMCAVANGLQFSVPMTNGLHQDFEALNKGLKEAIGYKAANGFQCTVCNPMQDVGKCLGYVYQAEKYCVSCNIQTMTIKFNYNDREVTDTLKVYGCVPQALLDASPTYQKIAAGSCSSSKRDLLRFMTELYDWLIEFMATNKNYAAAGYYTNLKSEMQNNLPTQLQSSSICRCDTASCNTVML